ncbi:MAG: hypothetical protein WBF87_02695, partial [Mesorhizobium sp.]
YQRVIRPNMTDIEVMGDLKVENAGIWRAVSFTSRAAFDVPGGRVFAPDLAEQIALFELFGRPKDLDKAARAADTLR